MRILYVNVPTSVTDWESQTEHNYFLSMFASLPNVTYFYAFNQASPPRRPALPNVRYFPVRMDENRYRNSATVPWEVLDLLHDSSESPFDLVVTHRPTVVAPLKIWMESVCKVSTPIVCVDSFVPHEIRSVQPPKKENYYRLSAIGYAAADALIAQCDYEYQLMLDTAYRWSGVNVKDKTFKLESKLTAPQADRSEKTKSVLFGQKMTKGQRGGNEVMEVLRKFSWVRPDIQIFVTSQKRNPMRIDGKNVQEVTNLSRVHYKQLLRRSMVGFTMSKDEGLPKGLIEQVLADVIVFVPKAQWALQLFKNDYAYYYESEADLIKSMAYAVDHYAECVDRLQPFKERMAEAMQKSVWDVILGVVPQEYMDSVMSYVSSRLHKMPERMTFGEYLDLLDVRKLVGGYNGYNTHQLYQAIKKYGWTDSTSPDGTLVLERLPVSDAIPAAPA